MRDKWDRRHYGNGVMYGAICIAQTVLKLDDYYNLPARSGVGDREESSSATGSFESERVDPDPRKTTAAQPGERRSSQDTPQIDMDVVKDAQ